MVRPASSLVDEDWRTLLQSLPGYDPFRSPGDAWFDPAAAQRALDFIGECIHHVEGALAGELLHLEDWQRSFVANLFGWLRKDRQGRTIRRYKEAILYVPRKSGKSPLGAAIALCVFFCDGERGQQNYIAAADREQAGKLFRHIKGMVQLEPELKSRCRIYGGTAAAGQCKSIVKTSDEGSFIQVISADADSQHGGNAHLTIVDELHAQPSRDLVDVLTTSTASLNRKQTLTIYLTTADFERLSICNEKHKYACQVRDGITNDPEFLPAIWEAGPDDDWTDPVVWGKANPNLGVSVSEEYLERECRKAQSTPAYENTFRRLHLNQKTQTDVRWLSLELWRKGSQPIDRDVLRGLPCYAGLDFGWRDDYAALVLLFPDGPAYQCLAWFWLPKEGRRDLRAHPTADFIAEGLISLTEGNSTDMDAIYETLRECASLYDLREIAIDPSNARKQGQDLMNEGFQVFEFVQSKKHYNEPCRLLETLLNEGRIRHGDNAVLNWMASNVTIEQNGMGEMMPKKVKSSEKIDGICALVMALARAMMQASAGECEVHVL